MRQFFSVFWPKNTSFISQIVDILKPYIGQIDTISLKDYIIEKRKTTIFPGKIVVFCGVTTNRTLEDLAIRSQSREPFSLARIQKKF